MSAIALVECVSRFVPVADTMVGFPRTRSFRVLSFRDKTW
jgi:hypothetical protein